MSGFSFPIKEIRNNIVLQDMNNDVRCLVSEVLYNFFIGIPKGYFYLSEAINLSYAYCGDYYKVDLPKSEDLTFTFSTVVGDISVVYSQEFSQQISEQMMTGEVLDGIDFVHDDLSIAALFDFTIGILENVISYLECTVSMQQNKFSDLNYANSSATICMCVDIQVETFKPGEIYLIVPIGKSMIEYTELKAKEYSNMMSAVCKLE